MSSTLKIKSSSSVFGFGWLLLVYLYFISICSFGNNGYENDAFTDHTSSIFNDPELTGPERLCIIFGFVYGEFSGNGIAETDVYTWLIVAEDGREIFDRTGGGTFQNIIIPFTAIGDYTVSLSVRRGNEIIYETSRTVTVLQGPVLAIQPDYLLCGSEPATLTALDPQTPNLDLYTFEWKNGSGEIIGNENSLVVTEEGTYSISFYFTNSSGGADCLVSGTTYAGPPSDFTLSVSNPDACLGETITIAPNIPQRGEWSALKQGETTRFPLGSWFDLRINSEEDLQGPGVYEIFYSVLTPSNPLCASERSIGLEINERPQFESKLIQSASDCGTQDGAFNILANTPLDKIEIEELDYENENIGQNEILSFTNLNPGIYTISTSRNNCTLSNIIIVPNENPPANQVYTIEEVGEVCSETGRVPGKLRLTFPGQFVGSYRVVRQNGSELESGTINGTTIEIDVPNGDHALEVFDAFGCSLPEVSLPTIPSVNLVTYSVPAVLNVCESFELIPETEQNLQFTLTTPSGDEIVQNNGEPFVINEEGTYTILGETLDVGSGLCPNSQTFTATISEVITFDAILASQDCFGNRIYLVELYGLNPNLVTIRWLNEDGDIVGRGMQWIPVALGTFFLEVQPRGSGFCPTSPVEFFVEIPLLEVEIALEAEPLCLEADFATVSMVTEFGDLIKKIEWIFIDPEGNITFLTEFENATSIEAENEGSYEVVVFGEVCELGRDLVLVMRSMDENRPVVDEIYIICSESNFGETINPGEFEAYEWYFQGELVADTPTFRPLWVGDYELMVFTSEGCSFTAAFSTREICEFQFTFPTGMVLNDPMRLFEVYVNEPVEEAEVWIYNRQGQLLFYCEGINVGTGVSFCPWDGTHQGRSVPAGTYTVTLRYRSDQLELNGKIARSLVIFE